MDTNAENNPEIRHTRLAKAIRQELDLPTDAPIPSSGP